jgi:hypothetical protein
MAVNDTGSKPAGAGSRAAGGAVVVVEAPRGCVATVVVDGRVPPQPAEIALSRTSTTNIRKRRQRVT